MTRLPDGHVLKGSRPAQRKNAQFWMEVAEDREELLEQVHPSPTEEKGTKEPLGQLHASPTEQEDTDELLHQILASPIEAEDTKEPVDQVHLSPTEVEDTKEPVNQVHESPTEAEDVKVVKATPKRKPRATATVTATREKKAGTTRKPRTPDRSGADIGE